MQFQVAVAAPPPPYTGCGCGFRAFSLSVCLFLQEIADARLIRNKILTNFERATQVGTSDQERRRLLHFVIVGGGPTGVEFSAELYDFLKQVCKNVQM